MFTSLSRSFLLNSINAQSAETSIFMEEIASAHQLLLPHLSIQELVTFIDRH
jgi:hypothetical protein